MNSSQKTGQPSLWHLIMYPKKYVHILYQAGLVTCCKLKFMNLYYTDFASHNVNITLYCFQIDIYNGK